MDVVDAEDFLELVWGEREGWVDLPAKVGGYWIPWYHKWNGEATNTVTRRIDSCLRDGESLYFSCARFTERGRDEDEMEPPGWLWADLDEVHPEEAGRLGLLPTVAWSSSPGRFQALWRLTKRVKPETFDRVNQALSYALGADRGGWDRTQVLRVPGTRNFKYPNGPRVELLWHREELAYSANAVWKAVRSWAPRTPVGMGHSSPAHDSRQMQMPVRVRSLLRVEPDAVVEGERSTRLWEISCLLAEAGWGEDSIYEVVESSAWNKWATEKSGETRLRRDIRKAIRHVLLQGEPSTDEAQADAVEEDPVGDEAAALPFVRYASFMAMRMEEPKWLIEGLWSGASHGIIGGEPKTSKTTLALGLGLSVASGKPWLGFPEFKVGVRGPVLMVQEENAPWVMQDRMRKIASLYGLMGEVVEEERPSAGSMLSKRVELDFPTDLPFKVLNNYGFNLADEAHRGMLEAEVRAVRPALVILDPLYLIFGGVNPDKTHELAPFFRWLLQLRYTYDCAVVVVHHMRKQQQNMGGIRSGQRLMGSATLHGWVDSALYCEKVSKEGETPLRVKVEREFRSVAPHKPFELDVAMGKPGDLEIEISKGGWDLGTLIANLVSDDPGITAANAGKHLSLDTKVVLSRARGSGLVEIKKAGKPYGHQSYKLYPATNGKLEGE